MHSSRAEGEKENEEPDTLEAGKQKALKLLSEMQEEKKEKKKRNEEMKRIWAERKRQMMEKEDEDDSDDSDSDATTVSHEKSAPLPPQGKFLGISVS